MLHTIVLINRFSNVISSRGRDSLLFFTECLTASHVTKTFGYLFIRLEMDG